MNVFWLEQTESDLPATNDWLSRTETALLSAMRFPKRRADWRLGRWTAKRALSVCLGWSFDFATAATVEILAVSSGQPDVFVGGSAAPVSISLSHRAGVALCAMTQAGVAIGCDLEIVEAHSDAFAADYFTAEERALISGIATGDRPLLLSLLWSAKESTLKALHQGLRIHTCDVSVHLDLERQGSESWLPFQVRYIGGTHFRGCWSRTGDVIRTIVAAVPSLHPLPLDVRSNDRTGTYADYVWGNKALI
jgi:4'-phosphopantetheinyl transferase